MEMADGVVFLPSFYEAICNLDDPDRVKVYDAVICYGLYGELPELPPHLQGYFVLMQPVIDSSQRRYKAAKENGSKPPREGSKPRGRPKKQTINQNEKQTINHDTDIDSDIDSDIDTDIDIEKDLETETDRIKRLELNKKRFLEGLNSKGR